LFVYSFCLSIFLPFVFSSFQFLFFAPFLVQSFYRCPLHRCLWWALASGFIIDLLSSQTLLGTYAINYCLTTLCLYRYRFYFFEDRLSTLPIMTFSFVCVSTVIHAIIFYIIGKPFVPSWEWVGSDLVMNPLQNALYAGLAFTLPPVIISHVKRSLSLFLLFKRRKS
jgi:rod shape-determining protein MreD